MNQEFPTFSNHQYFNLLLGIASRRSLRTTMGSEVEKSKQQDLLGGMISSNCWCWRAPLRWRAGILAHFAWTTWHTGHHFSVRYMRASSPKTDKHVCCPSVGCASLGKMNLLLHLVHLFQQLHDFSSKLTIWTGQLPHVTFKKQTHKLFPSRQKEEVWWTKRPTTCLSGMRRHGSKRCKD